MAAPPENYGKENVHFNLARMKAGGETFEVIIHPDAAMAFRSGQGDLADVLVYDRIFSDAKKGLAVSEHVMKTVFNTIDHKDVARQIVLKGEIQLTSEYREKLREEKRRAIVNYIHRMAIDPSTGFPHPPARIETAMAEAKVRVDEHQNAESQVPEIVKQLLPILPIKFEVRQVEIKVPVQFASKAHQILKRYCPLLKDQWQSDGSLLAVVEVPAGLQQELYGELNKLTHGAVESKLIGKV